MLPGPPPPPGVTMTCYRHPDRKAGVSCQRCDRPICPSCMVTASVGFQCPECAHSGAKQQRLVDVGRHASQPVVTNSLIAINIAVFVVGSAFSTHLGHGLYPNFDTRFSLWAGTARLNDGSHVIVGVANGEWWRIVTGGFMHANLLHIAFNMFALWSVGNVLERVIGRTRFLLIYAVSLLGGAFGALAFTNPDAPTVGASGAIFGIFGALVVLQRSRGISLRHGGIIPTILLNLVITFTIPGISAGGHVGGLLTGGAVSVLLIGHSVDAARRREASLRSLIPIAIVLGAALFLGSIWAAHHVVVHGALLTAN